MRTGPSRPLSVLILPFHDISKAVSHSLEGLPPAIPCAWGCRASVNTQGEKGPTSTQVPNLPFLSVKGFSAPWHRGVSSSEFSGLSSRSPIGWTCSTRNSDLLLILVDGVVDRIFPQQIPGNEFPPPGRWLWAQLLLQVLALQ